MGLLSVPRTVVKGATIESLSLSVRDKPPQATAPEGDTTESTHTLGLAQLPLNPLFLDVSRNVYILKQGRLSDNYVISFSSYLHLSQSHAYSKVKGLYGLS